MDFGWLLILLSALVFLYIFDLLYELNELADDRYIDFNLEALGDKELRLFDFVSLDAGLGVEESTKDLITP